MLSRFKIKIEYFQDSKSKFFAMIVENQMKEKKIYYLLTTTTNIAKTITKTTNAAPVKTPVLRSTNPDELEEDEEDDETEISSVLCSKTVKALTDWHVLVKWIFCDEDNGPLYIWVGW